MNKTNFEHAFFAPLMMLPFILLGNALAGAVFGIAFFLGREHAQAQSKTGYDMRGVFKAFDLRLCRLQLLAIGKLADVDAAIAALPEPAKSAAQIEWEYAATVERNSPLIGQLGPALEVDDEQMDALFRQAVTL